MSVSANYRRLAFNIIINYIISNEGVGGGGGINYRYLKSITCFNVWMVYKFISMVKHL